MSRTGFVGGCSTGLAFGVQRALVKGVLINQALALTSAISGKCWIDLKIFQSRRSTVDVDSMSGPIIMGELEVFGEEVECKCQEIEAVGHHPRVELFGSDSVVRGDKSSNLTQMVDTISTGPNVIESKSRPVRSVD